MNDSSQPALTLAAGNYTIVLTEQGNNPIGTLADGFSEDAANGNDPAFTGTNAGQPGSMFLDPGNFSQRTNAWELDVITSSPVAISSVPEPGCFLLGGLGVLVLFLLHARTTSRLSWRRT